MTALDRAFIRAFGKKHAASTLRRPHVAVAEQSAQQAGEFAVSNLIAQVRQFVVPPAADVEPVETLPVDSAAPVEVEQSTTPAEPSPGRIRIIHNAHGPTTSRPHVVFPSNSAPTVDEKPQEAPVAELPATEIAAPSSIEVEPLRPLYQVDHFRWPELCHEIIRRAGSALDHTVHHLIGDARNGRKVVAVTGASRGEGRTTLLLCLAQRLVAAGVKTVVVDADFANPSLASHLGIAPQADWSDLVNQQQSLADVLVESIADHLTLLPLRDTTAPSPHLADDLYAPVTINALRENYQVVLVDAGTYSDTTATTSLFRGKTPANIDAAIVLRDVRQTDVHPEVMTSLLAQLHAAGIEVTGIAENFLADAA